MKAVSLSPQSILLAINVLLGASIIVFWSLGAGPWQPPAAVKLEPTVLVPFDVKRPGLDMAMLNAIAERPLFVPERRPVAVEKKTTEAEAAPDIFNDIQLVGIIGEGAQSVVIVNIGGKARRVRKGEQLEGWTLQEINGRTARFGHGTDQNKELVMRYAVQGRSSAVSAPVAATTGSAATQSPQAPPPQTTGVQAAEDFVAARRARREALLRSRGLIK